MRSILLLLLGSTLYADARLGGPITYSTPSPNGEYLFVMLAPRAKDGEPAPEKREHEKALYEKYQATGSGLYRNDGSTKPLWTVDWYSYRAKPADDGIHLVRFHGEFPLSERFPAGKRLPDETVAEQLNDPGLSFYESGELLKLYAVRELVAKPESLPHSLQHVLWSADGVFTKENQEFCLMTQDSRQIFFDIRTGKINREREAGLGNAQVWAVRIGLAAVLVCGCIIAAAALYRWRTKAHITDGATP